MVKLRNTSNQWLNCATRVTNWTPEMRKKKMESLNKHQKLDYLETLTKPNQSGAHKLESDKRRFTLDALKRARKETKRKEQLDRK